MAESGVERKGAFQLAGYSLLSGEVEAETQGRKLEAGTDAEAVEECHLRACSSHLAPPAF